MEDRVKALEERMERLEKLWEQSHHALEMSGILIQRLTGILIRYWGSSGQHREAVLGDIRGIRNAVDEHFKSHYLDKKDRIDASKRKSTTNNNKLTNIYKGAGGVS